MRPGYIQGIGDRARSDILRYSMSIKPKLDSWLLDPEPSSMHPAYEDKAAGVVIVEGSSTEVDLRKFASPVEDQRWLNSCVGNAVVGGLELLRLASGHDHVDLSRLFVYYNARNEHSAQTLDKGTYIRSAMLTLQKLGVCKEETWAYNMNKVFVRPSWNSYREAYLNKIDDYYRIRSYGSSRLDAIETALRARHPVAFGMKVDDKFVENRDGHPKFTSSSKWEGRHAMLIVGFNKTSKTLIVRNSWGTSWGDDGYCYLPYDALQAAESDDFWVMTGLS